MARSDDSERAKSDRELLEEVVQRARRTETRVTKIANHVGVEAGETKPMFNEFGELHITHRKTSLDELLAALPAGHKGRVDIYCGDDFIVTLLA
jgi:hypothetical protein